MSRQCSRTGCAEAASVTLSYQYARSMVWLDELTDERDPHSYDLCQRHTARLSVPNGWTSSDQPEPPSPVRDRKRRSDAERPSRRPERWPFSKGSVIGVWHRKCL